MKSNILNNSSFSTIQVPRTHITEDGELRFFKREFLSTKENMYRGLLTLAGNKLPAKYDVGDIVNNAANYVEDTPCHFEHNDLTYFLFPVVKDGVDDVFMVILRKNKNLMFIGIPRIGGGSSQVDIGGEMYLLNDIALPIIKRKHMPSAEFFRNEWLVSGDNMRYGLMALAPEQLSSIYDIQNIMKDIGHYAELAPCHAELGESIVFLLPSLVDGVAGTYAFVLGRRNELLVIGTDKMFINISPYMMNYDREKSLYKNIMLERVALPMLESLGIPTDVEVKVELLSFSDAIKEMKRGKPIARKNDDWPFHFITLTPGRRVSRDIVGTIAERRFADTKDNAMVTVLGNISAINKLGEHQVSYQFTHSDILTDDWYVFDI